MKAKNIIRTAILASVLFLSAGCVFPYNPDIKRGSEYPLVVEGDIHPGGSTSVAFSYVMPFDKDEYEVPDINVKAYVEGENGVRVSGEDPTLNNSRLTLTFDTSALPSGQKYRLHFDTTDSVGGLINSFESDWLEVAPPPVIDELSFHKDTKFSELQFAISMHCSGAHHFRWYYLEEWEYHSQLNTYLYFDDEENKVKEYESGQPNLYYCWNRANSSSINIFNTSDQSDDRFEDLAFYSLPLNSLRLQVMYRMTLHLESISDESYEYWYNLDQNSQGQGSIFSPVPSSLVGNIGCITDPSVQVIGCICASVPDTKVIVYDNRKLNYYTGNGFKFDEDLHETGLDPNEWTFLYHRNYLPLEELWADDGFTLKGYKWVKDRCVDCRRASSGSKDKPADWPTDDK